jgi:hypothetical protein
MTPRPLVIRLRKAAEGLYTKEQMMALCTEAADEFETIFKHIKEAMAPGSL